MDPDTQLREKILETLIEKSNLKQKVFDNTFTVFNDLKESLHELSTEIDETLEERVDKRIRFEYRDRGKFEAQIQVAGDILIFTMHSNVFDFHPSHKVWKNPYSTADRKNPYCGVINIYNFLADSFKYNRSEDEGYLIGRIYVNHQMQFFVEGEGLQDYKVENFGKRQIDRAAIMQIIETAIYYALNFDLLAPPFNAIKRVNVEQFNNKLEYSKLKIGKRLGFDFAEEEF